MTESVITEFTGSQRDKFSRLYRYGVSGVTVFDSRNVTRRLYRFDPSSGTMTENDPAQPGKILRRFVFDNFGMLEETFSFGQPPRTFKYEEGGRQIVMREGGSRGAVAKTFSFEGNGVAETAFGRNGEIENVYVFDQRAETITIRSGGWFGAVERTLVFERIDISVFRQPEAFLQFLMFTEKSAREVEAEVDEQVAQIRGHATPPPGQSRYAYTGPRHASDSGERSPGTTASRDPVRPDTRSGDRPASYPARGTGVQARGSSGTGIDFIPDGDSSSPGAPACNPGARDRNSRVTFEERWQSARPEKEDLSVGRSARIPVEERFRSSRDEDRTLSPGRSVEIPLEERFRSSREEDRTLSKGRSVEIPLEERFQSSRDRDRTLSRGRSVEIPLEERFQGSRGEDKKLSRGKSVEIPLEERFQGSRDEDRTLSEGKSSRISYEERKAGRRP
jgi:hypothetical protein